MPLQEMKRAKVLFGQPLPTRPLRPCPEVARQAAGEMFAAIVDLGQRLLALIANRDLVRHLRSLRPAPLFLKSMAGRFPMR